MTSDQSKSTSSHGFIVSPSTGLMKLPDGGSSALSEIISRSLLHIKTSRDLVTPVRKAGEECAFEIVPGVKIVMCWIPPGEFLMGSIDNEAGRTKHEIPHLVSITKGFWLGKYQVTQSQWEAVMGSQPSRFIGANLPVEQVSWNDISGSGGFLENLNGISTAGGIFTLPTEAQWEYACRGGTVSAFNNGKNFTPNDDACPHVSEVAWYDKNSGNKTHPVGLKQANSLGLHDMHGNVIEWCSDWYAAYPSDPQVDPLGPDSGKSKIQRGGCYCSKAIYNRTAYRGWGIPSRAGSAIGFRVARSQDPEAVGVYTKRTNL
jgi:formylglycine-generating enzyme required for sulfatase activity